MADSDTDLADRECIACTPDTDPLRGDDIDTLSEHLDQSVWTVVDEHHLDGHYEFEDFRGALEFSTAVGELAEAEGHHPEIHISWGEVGIEFWTHTIDGLSETDFIMAARVDRLFEASRPDMA